MPTYIRKKAIPPSFGPFSQIRSQLSSKCEELPECKRYVTLLFDEMKVTEDIVYDNVSGDIIGFCNLGSLNDELLLSMTHMPILLSLSIF